MLSRCSSMRSSTCCSICRRSRNGNSSMQSSTCGSICRRNRNGNSSMRSSTCGKTWKSGRSGNNPMRRSTCGTVLLSLILHNNPILSYVLSPAFYPANKLYPILSYLYYPTLYYQYIWFHKTKFKKLIDLSLKLSTNVMRKMTVLYVKPTILTCRTG